MADPHPGVWELLEVSKGCELSTIKTAVHAFVVVTDLEKGTWKVMYFEGFDRRSFLWDPDSPTVISEPALWPLWLPAGSDFPNLFCAGHSHMVDGRLLVAGGTRPPDLSCQPPQPRDHRGLVYTYIFDPVAEAWSRAGLPPGYHPLADGRWYPTLTTLGEDPGYGMVLAMSGWRSELSNCLGVVNRDPEVYHPTTGWSLMQDPQAAKQPFNPLYLGVTLSRTAPMRGRCSTRCR
jgi:hypothetical protein